MAGPDVPPPPLPPPPPLKDEPPPARRPSRMIFVGIGSGIGLYILGFLLVLSSGFDSQGYWSIGILFMIVVLTVLLVIAATIMVIIGQTRQLAIGLFIGIGVGVLVDSGVCIGLLQANVG